MNTLVALVMRLMGLGSALDALDGESSKAYTGAVQKILLGGSGLLGGLAGIAGEFLAAKGAAGYLAVVQNLKHDPAAGAVVIGYGLIVAGYTDIGQRHAVAKLAASKAPEKALEPQAGPLIKE